MRDLFSRPWVGDPAHQLDVLLLGEGELFRLDPAAAGAGRAGRDDGDNGIHNSAGRIQRPGNGAPVPRANGYRLTFAPPRRQSLPA